MLNTELLIDDLCKNGYHLIENFLPEDAWQDIYNQAQRLHETNTFLQAKIGQRAQNQQNLQIRSDAIHWVDESEAYPELTAYFSTTNALRLALNEALFLGLQELEAHFAVYQPGAFYRKHCDQFATTKNRKISCVYYLNPDWQETDGGQIELYDKNDATLATVYPLKNRFICFNSELLHEVHETKRLRFSLTGWMKTRN